LGRGGGGFAGVRCEHYVGFWPERDPALAMGEALILSERVAVRPLHAKALLISTKWQKTKIHSGM